MSLTLIEQIQDITKQIGRLVEARKSSADGGVSMVLNKEIKRLEEARKNMIEQLLDEYSKFKQRRILEMMGLGKEEQRTIH